MSASWHGRSAPTDARTPPLAPNAYGRLTRNGSIPRQNGGQFALDVDVPLVRHVEDDLDDAPAGEGEFRSVFAADRVAAVAADAQSFPAEREAARLRPEIAFSHDVVVDVELHLAEPLAMLAVFFLGERDAD